MGGVGRDEGINSLSPHTSPSPYTSPSPHTSPSPPSPHLPTP
ncbi:hypothetical protein [Nostoc sp. FACHB-857]|nr:hypothetical protein [Nostoc sp. FACHB-857]